MSTTFEIESRDMENDQLIPPTSQIEAEKIASFRALLLEIIKRTVPTALSYDFSIDILATGALLTRIGRGDIGPAVTSLTNTLGFFEFAGILPASYRLAGLFGELEKKQEQKNALAPGDEQALKLEQEIKQIQLQIGKVPRNALIASSICMPVILAMIFSRPVLSFLGQTDAIASGSESFFKPYAMLFLLIFPRTAMEFVLLAAQKQVAAMKIAIAMLLATVGLQYILGFQTSLAVAGIGIGGSIGIALTSLGFTAYVAFAFKHLNFFKQCSRFSGQDWQEIVSHIKTAIPIILSSVSDVSVSFAVSILAGLLNSDQAILEQNVASQYLNFNAIIVAAVSQTTAFVVSTERGKAKASYTESAYQGVRQAALAGPLAGLLLQLPFAIVICAAPDIFTKIIGSEDVDASRAQLVLLGYACYALIDAIRYNLLQSCRATTNSAKDNTTLSIVSSVLLWSGVAAAYGLSQRPQLGVIGLPIGLLIGGCTSLLFLAAWLNQKLSPKALFTADQEEAKKQAVVSENREVTSTPLLAASSPRPEENSAERYSALV
jgi:Na+-driven multidrug efflux pump